MGALPYRSWQHSRGYARINNTDLSTPGAAVKPTRLLAAGLVLALAVAGLATAANPAAAESNGGVRVMPLGDSITEGTQVPGGYRGEITDITARS